jgi:hypothetical protein
MGYIFIKKLLLFFSVSVTSVIISVVYFVTRYVSAVPLNFMYMYEYIYTVPVYAIHTRYPIPIK